MGLFLRDASDSRFSIQRKHKGGNGLVCVSLAFDNQYRKRLQIDNIDFWASFQLVIVLSKKKYKKQYALFSFRENHGFSDVFLLEFLVSLKIVS